MKDSARARDEVKLSREAVRSRISSVAYSGLGWKYDVQNPSRSCACSKAS
jgi:hypothetical protein